MSHMGLSMFVLWVQRKKTQSFFKIIEFGKTLKRELSQFLFHTIVQQDRKRVKLSLEGRVTSNTLASVKIARSLGNLFMFRESEKELKGNSRGFLFHITFTSLKKVIKVYSVTFSHIYEHEKEQWLRSVTYSHVLTSMRKNKD